MIVWFLYCDSILVWLTFALTFCSWRDALLFLCWKTELLYKYGMLPQPFHTESPISHEIQIDMVPPWLFLLLCTSIIDEVSAPLRTISSTVCSGNSKAKLYRFVRRVGKAFRSPWAVLLQSSVCLFFSFLWAWTDWAILLTAN